MTEHYGRHVIPEVPLIRELALQGKIIISRHAAQRMLQRGIGTDEVYGALAACSMLDRGFVDDPRGEQIRVTGPGRDNEPLVLICAVTEGNSPHDLRVVVITVYWLDSEEQ